jgi:hypothetical protein
MRSVKMCVAALVIAVVLTVALAPVAGAKAATPKAVSGVWSWSGGEFIPTDPVDGNTYFSGYEYGKWTGAFRGCSYEPFAGVAYADESLWAIITIDFRGRVNGVSGEMVMQLTVDANTDGSMGGQWAIISGAGGLRHLRGVGTWVFTHASSDDVYGFADYEGVVWKTPSAKCTAAPTARARSARPW